MLFIIILNIPVNFKLSIILIKHKTRYKSENRMHTLTAHIEHIHHPGEHRWELGHTYNTPFVLTCLASAEQVEAVGDQH